MDPLLNTLLGIWQAFIWPGRQMLKLFGVSPEPIVSFGAPYDYAAESHVVFPHIDVFLRRQHWLGEIRKIEDCGVRLRLWRVDQSESAGIVAQGVWAPNMPAENSEHLTLFEGPYTSFRIPLVVYSMLPDYRKPGLAPGAYIANESFIHPYKWQVIALRAGEYFLAVDLVKGNTIRASTRFLLSISETSNYIAIERLISESNGEWGRNVFRASIAPEPETGVVVHRRI